MRCLSPMQLPIALFAIASFGVSTPANADQYDVTFGALRGDDDGALRRAEVSARLTPDRGRIRLNRNGEDTGLYHGWATFLLNIEAADEAGNTLELVYEPHGEWRLPKWRRGPVTVRYSMALQHDRLPNEPGDDELAAAKDFGVMWTGRALFIEGAISEDVSVRFEGPKDWRVTTPWQSADEAGLHFQPENTDNLLDSAFLAGVHNETIKNVAGVETRIALDPAMHDERVAIVKTLETYLPEYVFIFQADAVSTPIIIGLRGSFWGGGVMGRSISLTHGGDWSDDVAPMLDYIVGHELFHLWNAQWNFDAQTAPALAWLGEGAAEYYTWLANVRTGNAPQHAFFDEIGNRWATYRNALVKQSIAKAGITKLESSNSYDLIYSGGMMTVLALDMAIREKTNGDKSFDDALRAIHGDFSGDGARSLTKRNFIKTIKAETGYDATRFFRRYIERQDVLPMDALMTQMGLCITEDSSDDALTASVSPCPENADGGNFSDDDSIAQRRSDWLSN